MTEPRPRIAVPARLTADESDPRVAAANRILHDVVDLVRDAGLDPVIVTDADLAEYDGVVLPGGGDVDPARYGSDRLEGVYDVNPAQDDLDFGIAQVALDQGLPILGICRGLQVLNTMYGGTLHEDLEPSGVVHTDPPGAGLEWSWHPVDLAPESSLAEAIGTTTATIASGHHQGIRVLGRGLRAIATSPDGLIEAFEDPTRAVLAVQWHPEAEGTPAVLRDAPFRVFAEAVRAGQDAARSTNR